MESGVVHLLEASIKLKCSIEVTARSLLLYHHFRRCANDNVCDQDIIAAGALHLGARLYEQVIDQDSLICVFYSIVNKKTEVLCSDDAAYILLKKTIIGVDFMMLRVFEFEMNHRLAHQYLVPFFAMIFERSKNIADFHGELGRTCIRFLSDFYTQKICLEYSPELIAIACVDLSLHVHGLINDLTMIPAWYMGFICHVTPDKVRAIRRLIMNLYEKTSIPIQAQQPVQTLEEQVAEQAGTSAQNYQIPLAPIQQVSPTSLQQILPNPVQVLPSPRQFLSPSLQLLPTQQVLPCPRQQFLPNVQNFLSSHLQQVEIMDIADSSPQKS